MPGLPALPVLVNQGETLGRLAAEGFAGVHDGSDELILDRKAAEQGLDALYATYLRGKDRRPATPPEAMPSLLPSEQSHFRRARAIFGLMLGPVSVALTLVDEQSDPAINNVQMLDALAKHVFLRRTWLLTMLERMGKPVVVWLYEPYLSVATSAFSPVTVEELLGAVDQALGHGPTRALWLPNDEIGSLIADKIDVDVLGLPLPDPDRATLVVALVQRLLAKRTAIGWGIVPVTAEGLQHASVGRLAARFETWLRALEAAGIPTPDVLAASLIMPEDILAYLEPEEAEHSLALTAELSSLIRQSYGVD